MNFILQFKIYDKIGILDVQVSRLLFFARAILLPLDLDTYYIFICYGTYYNMCLVFINKLQ